jgi:hypothetical protein
MKNATLIYISLFLVAAGVVSSVPPTHIISGFVMDGGGAGVGGVDVVGDNGAGSAVTGGDGAYSIVVSNHWDGTITVSKAGWLITPASKTYNNVSDDIAGQDYIAYQPTISGYVKDSGSAGIEGVLVSADNGGGSDTTDATGYYEFFIPYNWTGMTSATLAGYNFTPKTYSTPIIADQINQDYSGFQPTISGSTGAAGATVTFSGIGSVVSTPAYSTIVPYGWSGTVEVSLTGYNFIESPRDYTTVTADMTGQGFTPYQPTISGYVKDGTSTGIEGVSVSADNGGGGSDTTDANGYYEITVPYDWSGTITPNKTGLGFTEWSHSYTNVISNLINQDFIAFPLLFTDIETGFWGLSGTPAWGDYDNDGDLDLAFCGTWHDGTWNEMAKIYRNDGAGVFTEIATPLQGVSGTLAWADYDRDGDLDIALTGYMGGGHRFIRIYRNDGGNQFVLAVDLGEIQGSSISWGDYDNDGDFDLAVSGSVGHHVAQPFTRIYRNDGQDTFVDSGASVVDAKRSSLAWGDYDNDGDLDLALVGETTSGYVGKIYRNDNGELVDTIAGIEPIVGSLAWSDFDNDGDLDLGISGDNGANPVTKVYRNNGEAGFEDIGAVPTAISGSLSWADYDSDGDTDLIIAGSDGINHSVKIYRNDGNGLFSEENAFLPEVSGKMSWGDYDNDGDLDFAILGESAEGRINRIYRNCGNVFNTPPLAPVGVSSNRDSDMITLSWTVGSDSETPASGLSYNLRVGTAPGLDDIFAAMANLSTGLRRIPALGNAQKQLNWTLAGLDLASFYYWSVQTIDSAYAGSSWSQEQTVLPVPGIEVAPIILNFEAFLDGSDPNSQTLSISNNLFGKLNWTITPQPGCDWIRTDPDSGTSTGDINTVTVSIDISGLSAGTHNCILTISDPNADNSPQTVEVNLNVIGPILFLTPSDYNFQAQKDGSANQIISIQNEGGGTLNWQIDIPVGCGWLSANPASGQSSGEVDEATLNVDASGMEHGFYECQLTVSDDNAENSPQHVPVSLHVYTVGERHVPAEYETIQAAIDAAVDGDEVIIQPGRYTGVDNYNIYFGGKEITVRSIEPENPAIVAATIVDPEYAGNGFGFYDGEDANSILDGLTIRRAAYGQFPGGIVCQGSSPTIRNCTVEEAYSDGIILLDSSATISNCIVRNNGGPIDQGDYHYGFGIVCYEYQGDEIVNNSPSVTDCIISNNYLSGIYCADYKLETSLNITVANCIITGNGGAPFYYGGNLPTSYTYGGGILSAGGNLSVINCTFNGNRASMGGGICCLKYPRAQSRNIEIDNCIFWENYADDGPQIAMASYYYYEGFWSTLTVSNSDVQGGEDAVYMDPCDPCSTLNWGVGNIDIDPLFAEPGYQGPVSGLTSYWIFDEADGAIAYDSAGYNDGTIEGAQWTTGKIEGALEFDGVDDYVMVGKNDDIFPNNILTWSVWIKPFSYTSYGVILWDDDIQATGDRGVELRSDGRIGAGEWFVDTVSSFVISLDQWHHIAFTSGDGEMKLYIDGELNATSSDVLPDHTGRSFVSIGSGHTGYRGYFHGMIDEVAIYGRALSPEEIQDIYLNGLNEYGLLVNLPGDYHLKSETGRWEWSGFIELDPAGDGFIDMSDFAAFAGLWQEEGSSISADFDNSGIVDLLDLNILLDSYLADYNIGEWVTDDVTSSCIDVGDPCSDWSQELWPHGKRINMGAYGGTGQASMSLSPAGNKADFNKDGSVDTEDLSLFVDKWPVEEVLLAEDINRNGIVNFADWAEFAQQWLWQE